MQYSLGEELEDNAHDDEHEDEATHDAEERWVVI